MPRQPRPARARSRRMGAVELDRQGIERRDFPIVRRGYDPASVDAHLRALAADVEELQREASSPGRESLASTAGTQVQGILEAAQATAVSKATEALLGRVESLDGETRVLVDSLRAGAGHLAEDLTAVEREMGALY